MPSRISTSKVNAVQEWTNRVTKKQETYLATGGYDGEKQTISAFNNAGTFVPGKYRANAVQITKIITNSEPGETDRQSAGDFVNATFKGDIAGILAMSTNYENTCSSQAASGFGSSDAYSQNKALARSNEPDFDVGVILGELTETVGGLLNPLSAMRTYIKTWNKIQKSSAKRSLHDTFDMLTGSWLEWRYGIQPLISTISDGYKHFSDTTEKLEKQLERSKGGVNIPVAIIKGNVSALPGMYYITGDTEYRVFRKTVSSVIWQLTEPLTWQERYGLDGGNLLNILWEITPLSFVVDWWLGIGDWLGSVDFSGKRTMLGMTTSRKTVVDFRIFNVKAGLFGRLLPTGSSFTAKYTSLNRMVGQNKPLLPAVHPGVLSLNRQLDAASLLWQKMPKFWR